MAKNIAVIILRNGWPFVPIAGCNQKRGFVILDHTVALRAREI
jgi:hypothetical protein